MDVKKNPNNRTIIFAHGLWYWHVNAVPVSASLPMACPMPVPDQSPTGFSVLSPVSHRN